MKVDTLTQSFILIRYYKQKLNTNDIVLNIDSNCLIMLNLRQKSIKKVLISYLVEFAVL